MDGLGFRDFVGCSMVKNRIAEDLFELEGYYPIIQHIRNGEVIAEFSLKNAITNEGKNNIFDVYFNSGTQTSSGSWSIGLVNAASFTAFAATDTMASHAGWTEFTTYTQANRPAWGQGAASNQSVTNGTPAVFDFNGNGSLQGIFVTSNNTKGGTTGKLWATGAFNSPVAVVSGDQIKITYAVAA